MSYIGEYLETPYLSHSIEGDPYLRDFKITKNFPTLQSTVTRTQSRNSSSRPLSKKNCSRKAPAAVRTQKSIFKDFKSSVLKSGHGPIADFQGSLIREKLTSKKAELEKERKGLRQTAEAREREQRLHDANVTNRALTKMEFFARDFDADKVWARELLGGFSGRKMRCKEFREQLRRSLSLKLSMEETRALMQHFDQDDDGYIECHEFILNFFKMMFEARGQVHSLELEKRDRQDRAARDAIKQAEEQEEVRNYAILNTEYSPADLKRGIEALSRLAIWWDFGGYRDKLFIDPFFAILTPLQFQLQLQQSFGIKTTDAEMSALCRFFDTNNDGTVDGPEFLRGFFKMQQDFHAKVADRVNYDNECRIAMLEHQKQERPPPSMRKPSCLRKPQHKMAAAPRRKSTRLPNLDTSQPKFVLPPALLSRRNTTGSIKEAAKSRRASMASGRLSMVQREAPPAEVVTSDGEISHASAVMRRASLSFITSSKDSLHPDSTLFGNQTRKPTPSRQLDPPPTPPGYDPTEDRQNPIYHRRTGSFIYGGSSKSREALGTPPDSQSSSLNSPPNRIGARPSWAGEEPASPPKKEMRKGNSVLFGTSEEVDVDALKPKIVRWQGTHQLKDCWDDLGRRILDPEKMKTLQKRMQMAMYGSDPRKFFERYDTDKGGELDAEELKRCVRGNMKVGRKYLSDEDLHAFINTLDKDGDGLLGLDELLEFVKPPKKKKTQRLDEAAIIIQNVLRRRSAAKVVEEIRREKSIRSEPNSPNSQTPITVTEDEEADNEMVDMLNSL